MKVYRNILITAKKVIDEMSKKKQNRILLVNCTKIIV